MPKIVLASQSPRRRELFKLISEDFLVVEAMIEESLFSGESAGEQALKLAEMKCLRVCEKYPFDVVIGCDTLVELRGEVFGKPSDEEDAVRMLKALSGNTHSVFTGVCIRFPGEKTVRLCCKTKVSFWEMEEREMREYTASGDPLDKAGAYGIQGMAARYIREICGDYFNVMGLPVSSIYRELRARSII
ncbi:MAG: Maf family protein [Oscillospiraceae bacterium]|nr:Maf family protein [Oscillospiraceae bacterium]